MTIKTSIKSQIIIFLSIVILVMLFVVVFQKHAFEDISEMVAAIDMPNEKVSQDSEPISEEKRLQYENTIAFLKSQIYELQSPRGMDQNLVPTNSTESFIDIENERDKFRSKYKPLFEDLGLNIEDSESLLDIFLDQEVEAESIRTNINSMIGSGNVDGNGIPSIIDSIPSIAIDFENEIKEILGETNYEKYQLYEDTYYDRTMLNDFNNLLDDTNQFKNEQIDDLANVFYSIRSKYYDKPTYTIGSHSHTTETDEEILSKTPYFALPEYEKLERMKDEYIEKAEELFSKEQFDMFETYYNLTSPR